MSTPRSTQVGMMGRDNLEGGMLFLFDDIGERSFWMKNCFIPLDIIFIINNNINQIYPNCPPCKDQQCDHYFGIGNKVLELPGGSVDTLNIKEGDSLNFI